MTEHPDLNEDFVSAEFQYQIHERYLKSVEIGMNTAVTVSYTHLDVYKRQQSH